MSAGPLGPQKISVSTSTASSAHQSPLSYAVPQKMQISRPIARGQRGFFNWMLFCRRNGFQRQSDALATLWLPQPYRTLELPPIAHPGTPTHSPADLTAVKAAFPTAISVVGSKAKQAAVQAKSKRHGRIRIRRIKGAANKYPELGLAKNINRCPLQRTGGRAHLCVILLQKLA